MLQQRRFQPGSGHGRQAQLLSWKLQQRLAARRAVNLVAQLGVK
jgi:hypothetical protein